MSEGDGPDWYEILRLREDATADEISNARRREMRFWHPDTNSSPEAQSRAQLINEAYRVLSDPGRRAEYDAKRAATSDSAPSLILHPVRIDFGVHVAGAISKPLRRRVKLSNHGGTVEVVDAAPREGKFWRLELQGGADADVIAWAVFELVPVHGLRPGKYVDDVEFELEGPLGSSRKRLTVRVSIDAPAPKADEPASPPKYIPPPRPVASPPVGPPRVTPPSVPSDPKPGPKPEPEPEPDYALILTPLWILGGLAALGAPFGVMALAIPAFGMNDPGAGIGASLVMLAIGAGCLWGLVMAIFVALPYCFAQAGENFRGWWRHVRREKK